MRAALITTARAAGNATTTQAAESAVTHRFVAKTSNISNINSRIIAELAAS